MAVIRGVGVERAVGKRGPQRRLVGERAQRGRHHVAHRIGAAVMGLVEEQVVRAGLGMHGLAPIPRRGDRLERPAAGHVHHIGRRARQLGHDQEAVDALGLERDRAAARQRREAELAGGDEFPRQRIDHAAVLAMRQHDHAERRRLLHDREGDVVVGHDPELDVGQPQLDAADSQLGRLAHVAGAVGPRLPDHGVQSDIDARLGKLVGDGPPGRLGRSLAGLGVDEGKGRRRPAAQGRAGVRRDRAEDVRVDVDAAGEHEAAGRVHDLGAGPIDLPDRGDHAVADQHVAGRRPLRAHQRPAHDRRVTAHTVPSGRQGAAASNRRV